MLCSFYFRSMFKYVYYATMTYLALNKLLEILLNISYQSYCTNRGTKILLMGTWIVGFLFFISMCVHHSGGTDIPDNINNNNNNIINNNSNNISAPITNVMNFTNRTQKFTSRTNYNEIFTYFYTGFDIFFILIAMSTHGYLFHKYRHTRMQPSLTRTGSNFSTQKEPESLWRVFRNSRFYISCLLMATFVGMVVLPKFIYFFLFRHIDDRLCKHILSVVVALLYYLSFALDAVIYIFLHPPLKRLLWRELRDIPILSNFLHVEERSREESLRMTTLGE